MVRSPLFTWQHLLSFSEKVKVLNQPPYSPDLSPCDFFLFPMLKKMLSGNKYTSRSSLGIAIYQCLQQIPKENYLAAFHDWVKWVQKCVSVKGEYFEAVLQTSLLLMKSLNETETPIFLSVMCSLFPNAIILTFIVIKFCLISLKWSEPSDKTFCRTLVKGIFLGHCSRKKILICFLIFHKNMLWVLIRSASVMCILIRSASLYLDTPLYLEFCKPFIFFMLCNETPTNNKHPLRKNAYSNIMRILQPKKGTFSDKISDIFHISAQNIDCGCTLEPPRWGGSNEYPQSMSF